MTVTFDVPIVEIRIQRPSIKLKGGVRPIKQGPGSRGGDVFSPLKLVPIEAAAADANEELAGITLRQMRRQLLFVPALGSDWTWPVLRDVAVSAKYHIIGRLRDLPNAAVGNSNAGLTDGLQLKPAQDF